MLRGIMMKFLNVFAAATVLTGATTAQATTCAESFARGGSIVTATTFTATQSVANLRMPDAIAQLHGIAINGEYDVLEEDRASGTMLWEQRQSGMNRAIPVLIEAVQRGTGTDVTMSVRLPSGIIVRTDGARTEMCQVLGRLRGGAEGVTLARAMEQVGASRAPTVIDAYMLSNEFARQHNLNAALIPSRYRNRVFTVVGRMLNVDRNGGGYSVLYNIAQPPTGGLLRPLPGQPTFSISISCQLATGQGAYALSLRSGQSLRLTGAFGDYDEANRHLTLIDCRNTPRVPRVPRVSPEPR